MHQEAGQVVKTYKNNKTRSKKWRAKKNPSNTGEARAVQVPQKLFVICTACETLKFVCLHHYLWVIELQRVETPDVLFQFLGMSVLPIMVSLPEEPSKP